jgi:hypothetical protein
MLRWSLIVAGALVTLGIAGYVVGMLLPARHTARMKGVVTKPHAEIAAMLRDVRSYPRWRRGIVVEGISQTGDAITYIELAGNDRIAYQLTEPLRDKQFVATMTDPNLPFGGAWTITLTPEGGTTSVAIQEDGEVRNPLFRLLARYVFGYTTHLKKYLEDLGATRIGPSTSQD